jgi:predicted nucleotidyltransferase
MLKTAGTPTTAAHIACMVKRIEKKLHAQQIILLGLHARGEAGPDSDVDLLVVMPLRGMGMQVL